MRFIKLATVLFLLVIATVGVLVVIAHIIVPEVACLLYDTRDDQGGGVVVIEPTSEDRYVYSRAPAYLPRNPDSGDPSPDGTHQIYLTGPAQGPYSLYIDPKPLRQDNGYIYCFRYEMCWLGERAPNPQAHLIASGITQQFTAIWLDNERVVYAAPVDAQRQSLFVAHVDGSTQDRLPLTFEQYDTIIIQSQTEHVIVFMVDRSGSKDTYIWSLPDGRLVAYPSLGNNQPTAPTISSQGKYVTMLDQGHLVVLSSEKKERVDVAMQNQAFYDIDWAPDERHFAVTYQDNSNNRQTIIYGVDGTQIANGVTNGQWSTDGSLYLYLTTSGETRDLMVVHMNDGQLETVANNVRQLYGELDNGQFLALWGEDKQYTLGTLNLETKTQHVITGDITGIGDIRILHGGHTILYMVSHDDQRYSAEVINSDGSNHILLAPSILFLSGPYIINEEKSLLFYVWHDEEHSIALEMIDLNGSNHRTFVTGLEDIRRDTVWSNGPDGFKQYDSESPDYLALAGQRNGLINVEMVNLHTGEHQILAQGLSNMDGLGPDARVGGIRFYWERDNHEDGVAVYTMDGEPMFHLSLPGDYDYISDYQIFSYLLSPDKQVVAVTERYDNTNFHFMAADSSWQKRIEANLGAVGGGYGFAQAWSPDSKQFAFTDSDGTGNIIRILDEHGDEMHHVAGFAASRRTTLIWTRCE